MKYYVDAPLGNPRSDTVYNRYTFTFSSHPPRKLFQNSPTLLKSQHIQVFVSNLSAVPNKRALEEGCHDDNGKHYTVGERWREDFGSCKCYEDGSIGCVGEPLVLPQRMLLIFPISYGDSKIEHNSVDWLCSFEATMALGSVFWLHHIP